MNVIVMIGMMGLMLLIFHGRGHHRPSPEPVAHGTRPATSPAVPPGSPESGRPIVETRAEVEKGEGSGPETKPKSHPGMPVVPQAE